MSLRALVVIFVITSVCAKKRRNYDSDEEHGDDVTSSPVMDRLVLNLASAFVKSILPEVEQASIPISSELRRAPQSQNLFDQTTIGRSGAYSSILGEQDSPSTLHGTDGALFGKELSPSTTFPDLFALASSGQAPFGFANHQQQPFSRIASLNLRDIEALNKARNERYLADLRRHQRELQQYTANQIAEGSSRHQYVSTRSNEQRSKDFEFICDKCIPVNLGKLQGPWTQIYGNPTALRRKYSTVLNLKSLKLKRGTTTTNLSLRKASCVGFDVGKPRSGIAAMNLVFRDDSSGHELHQMNGVIAVNDDGSIRMELTNADSSVCLVKAGPVQKERYEYIVLAETDGTERCRIYHIYARNAEEFIKTHYDTIARFMKEEVLSGDALPVAALPKPHHCQSTS